MRISRSITARLSLAFLLLFLVVILLGVFEVGSLSYFNGVTAQVRDRWLPNTGVLSDLNNTTSDFRAAEAASLLAANARQLAASERQMDQLDQAISAAQQRYRQIPQSRADAALYEEFAADWERYRSIVRDVRARAGDGRQADAVELYNTTSKQAFDAASDALDKLTARNIASAREAAEREELAYQHARWLVLAAIIITGLCVAAAMTHVRRSISLPILALARRMHQLAANETDVELDVPHSHDEVAEMARAVAVFRDNAVELLNSRYALESQANMLRERLAEEQRLMQMQRNFISMASHEFRTPITVIDAHAQRMIAMKDRLSGEELGERARKVRISVRRMTLLIENLIDSSRVIDGDVQLYFHPHATDLSALLHEVCTVQREISPRAQILENLPARATPIFVDSNLLFQVFSNLISNAIKYSPGGGLITVRLAEGSGEMRVVVEDRGIGIDPADCERLFERYYRGANAAGIVGTGVGLYFVKTVVELHKGSVQAESREGGGSRFTVRLPLPMPETSPAPSAVLETG